MISIFKDVPQFPFIPNRYKAYLFSIIVMAVAIVSVALQGGLKLGVDFTGGTLLQVHFDQPIETDEVRRALADANMAGAEISKLKDTETIKNSFLIRTGRKQSVTVADTSGPQVVRIEVTPNPTAGASQVVVRALISDAGRGGARVDSAWCAIDGLANKTPMPPEPNKPEGSFWVVVPADRFGAGSQHSLAVYGRDAGGNWGASCEVTLFVTARGQVDLSPDKKARAAFAGKAEAARGGPVTAAIVGALARQFPDNPVTIDSDDTVGPKVGRELQGKATLAVLVALMLILIYVAFRFDFRFGVAAIISLFHDVICTVGFISVTGMEFNLQSVAVLLTIVGYSINDSIVVADRIRENVRKSHKDDFPALVNRSINETLSRTMITAVSVFLVLVALQLFSGHILQDFTKPLLFGLVFGTYSSIFIVAAIVVDWEIKSPSRRKK
ncbi:MAG: protein translocase subunit SecF [Candidatus Edwardsbacteria bacterium]|nr:protein translocase subunit SecF [Candidatus Edwardsbacteria bacterium]